MPQAPERKQVLSLAAPYQKNQRKLNSDKKYQSQVVFGSAALILFSGGLGWLLYPSSFDRAKEQIISDKPPYTL